MNIPEVKCGIISVSRDCFIISLSQNRRQAIVDAYTQNTATSMKYRRS